MKQKQKNRFKKSNTLFLLFFLTLTSLPGQMLSAQTKQELPSSIEKKVFTYDSNQDQQIVEGEIIVKYKKSSIDLNNDSDSKKADDLQQAKNLENIDEVKEQNVRLMKTQSTTAQTLADLKNDPNVEYAQPNFKKFPAFTPNDPFFPQQWGLGKIQAPLAWDTESSSDQDIVVAVIDTGLYYNHEDLLQNLWDGSAFCKDNTGATIPGGCPHHGWDFKNNDNDPIGESWISGTKEIGPHGTWVSGIMAATTNNSIGMSGMSRNNHIKIMALRFGLDTISEIKAINFAKNNGAKIINASFGGPDLDPLEKDAITSFGGIFVAAAGNNGTNNEIMHNYPSDHNNPNIISVAASDQNDALAPFSNYGPISVDIAAPGTAITTTYLNSPTSYASFDGTSAAAPFVSGAAALLESKNPTLTTDQIKNDILNSGDQLPNAADASKIFSGKRLNINSANLFATTKVPTPIFRFWSDQKQGHFYTASQNEKDSIIANDHSWKYEGVAYTAYAAPANGITPVYRFWSTSKQHHFFTANEAEKNFVIASDHSWSYEGIAYYAYANQQPSTTAVHRFWSDKKQGHFFTSNTAEKDFIIANDPSWKYEGIAWFVPTN